MFFSDVALYLHNWVQDYAPMFVSYITDRYKSYGQTTTCRVEAHHALLKLYLDGTQSKLDRLLRSVDKILITQEDAIKETFNRSMNEKLIKCDVPLFHELTYKVSKHALNLMHKELHLSIAPEDCSHNNRAIYGLPCFHEMRIYVIHGKYIKFITIKLFSTLISVIYTSHFN